jgi:hypothetical protein
MKALKKYITGIAGVLIAGIALVSCTKSFEETTVRQDNFSDAAIIQAYIATVGASRNYIYVDSKPVNGASLTTGTVFPVTGYGFNVANGLRSFLVRDTLSATTQIPLSFAQNLQGGKTYTMFLYDTITAPRMKLVESNIEVPTDTTARIRFANMVYTPNAIPAVDIFSVKRNANIFTNVQISDVTGFIPIASGVTDTFYIRPTGTTANIQNYRVATPTVPAAYLDILASLTPTIRRSYTLVFRGGFRATSTTNTTVRSLSVFINR